MVYIYVRGCFEIPEKQPLNRTNMKTLTVILLLSIGTAAFAQDSLKVKPSDYPRTRFQHQIFLPDSIKEVKRVVYADDSTDVDFKMSEDGKATYLLNYDGKRSIKIYYISNTGEPKNVQKPHCQVQDRRVEL